MKTSRALISKEQAFRIEVVGGDNNENNYDIIFQANGKDEEVAILIDRRDLKGLLNEIIKVL